MRSPLSAPAAALVAAALASACAATPPPAVPGPAALPDTALLRAHVGAVAARPNPERIAAVEALLRARGFAPRTQAFPNPDTARDPRATGRNLVVSLGSGARTLVVGAHLDAFLPRGGREVDGAVDNAAASVALVHLAERLRRVPLRHRVDLVWFDMEEIGGGGSRHYVAGADTARIAAMVNLDIAGYGDAVIFGPAASPGNEAVYRAVHASCAAERLTCIEFPRYPPSDDVVFQGAGVPNVSLGVLPAREAHQLWLMLNGGAESGLAPGFAPPIARLIHRPGDTLDRIDPAAMQLAIRAAEAVLRTLDAAPPR